MNNQTIIGTVTVLACMVITMAFICSLIYLASKNDEELLKSRRWIEQLPTMLSTLGVFGTFIGITIGLYFFNPESLNLSIQELLSGLKTAFVTSLLGMICSLILNKKVSTAFDNLELKDKGPRESAQLVADAIKAMQKSNEEQAAKEHLVMTCIKNNTDIQNTLTRSLIEKISFISTSVDQMRDDIEEIKGSHELIRETQQEVLEAVKAIGKCDGVIKEISGVTDEIGRLKAVTMTTAASLATMDNAISDINDATREALGKLTDIADLAEEMADRIH